MTADQVNIQFVAAVEKLQGVLSRAPAFLNQISSARSTFDLVLVTFMRSGIATIVAVVLTTIILWYYIFKNWRMRIMEMRQGR